MARKKKKIRPLDCQIPPFDGSGGSEFRRRNTADQDCVVSYACETSLRFQSTHVDALEKEQENVMEQALALFHYAVSVLKQGTVAIKENLGWWSTVRRRM